MIERRILKNSIICPDGVELISRYRHDFQCHYDKKKRCFCIDGGSDYLKRSGIGYTENSVIDDGLHKTRRDNLAWGVNTTEKSKKLAKTKWVEIKNLDDDHIYNILAISNIDEFYRLVLEDEIIYREEKWLNENKKL